MTELLQFSFSWVSWKHNVWKVFLFMEQTEPAWTGTGSIGCHSKISLHLAAGAIFPKEAGSINRSWIPAYLPAKMQLNPANICAWAKCLQQQSKKLWCNPASQAAALSTSTLNFGVKSSGFFLDVHFCTDLRNVMAAWNFAHQCHVSRTWLCITITCQKFHYDERLSDQ